LNNLLNKIIVGGPGRLVKWRLPAFFAPAMGVLNNLAQNARTQHGATNPPSIDCPSPTCSLEVASLKALYATVPQNQSIAGLLTWQLQKRKGLAIVFGLENEY